MAICINCDGICFGTYSITPSPTGICISGVFSHQGTELSVGASVQGTVSGYTSGGRTAPGSEVDTIDKFPFTSDTSASDVGELSQSRFNAAGQSSTISGYSSGGFCCTPSTATLDTIDKFPFSTDASASDVGELTNLREQAAGQISTVSGYTSGGLCFPALCNTIDKFPFAADASASDVGEISQTRRLVAGQSSTENGYTSGGDSPPSASVTVLNTIDKFPFTSDTSASDVGELTQARQAASGQSSLVSGYTTSGSLSGPSPPIINTIDKFPFASDTPASDVGEATQSRNVSGGTSSTVSGYAAGGNVPPSTNTIDKFPFSSDTSAADVGELTQSRAGTSAGQQI